LYFPFISSPAKEGGGEKKEVFPMGKGESKRWDGKFLHFLPLPFGKGEEKGGG